MLHSFVSLKRILIQISLMLKSQFQDMIYSDLTGGVDHMEGSQHMSEKTW